MPYAADLVIEFDNGLHVLDIEVIQAPCTPTVCFEWCCHMLEKASGEWNVDTIIRKKGKTMVIGRESNTGFTIQGKSSTQSFTMNTQSQSPLKPTNELVKWVQTCMGRGEKLTIKFPKIPTTGPNENWVINRSNQILNFWGQCSKWIKTQLKVQIRHVTSWSVNKIVCFSTVWSGLMPLTAHRLGLHDRIFFGFNKGNTGMSCWPNSFRTQYMTVLHAVLPSSPPANVNSLWSVIGFKFNWKMNVFL